MYSPYDLTFYLFVSGMLITFISSVSMMIQLQKAAGNPTWNILRNRDELEDAFSKEKAKKYKFSYFGSRFGPILMIIGVICWFIEKAIRSS